MASSKGSEDSTKSRYNSPMGKVPLLSESDDEVDWNRVTLSMRAFLMRFEGHVVALFER